MAKEAAHGSEAALDIAKRNAAVELQIKPSKLLSDGFRLMPTLVERTFITALTLLTSMFWSQSEMMGKRLRP